MLTLLYSIFGFILAVGILTTVHEYGHFVVARFFHVKVLRFSIGLGKPIWAWYDSLGTQYVISMLPIGGFVSMLGETDDAVPTNERHRAFPNKPVWMRLLIILAGPFANFAFAILAYWVVFMIGISSLVPVVGEVPKGSVADFAHLKRGDQILSVDKQSVSSWEDILMLIVSSMGENKFLTITVKNLDGPETVKTLNLTGWSFDNQEGNVLDSLGLEPYDPVKPIIGKVMHGMPADEIGLKPGDLITQVDDLQVDNRTQLTHYLRKKADQPVMLDIKRGNEDLRLRITPIKKILEGGELVGYIGIQYKAQPWPEHLIRTNKYSPIQAFNMAVTKTADYTILTVQFLWKMVSGKLSLQHIAGPISIAKFAGQTVAGGAEYFLGFLALVSISLGVLNMLPIPVLDGGHVVYCLYEMITKRSPSAYALQVGKSIGFVFILSLMTLAIYNDLLRL